MVDDDSDDAAYRGFGARDLIGLGGVLAGGVVGGLVVGILVDDAAGTSPTWTLVGVLVGVVLSIAGFVVRVRAALRRDSQ